MLASSRHTERSVSKFEYQELNIASGRQALTFIRRVLHIWQPLEGFPQYTIVIGEESWVKS
jgi:hypothetical protein